MGFFGRKKERDVEHDELEEAKQLIQEGNVALQGKIQNEHDSIMKTLDEVGKTIEEEEQKIVRLQNDLNKLKSTAGKRDPQTEKLRKQLLKEIAEEET